MLSRHKMLALFMPLLAITSVLLSALPVDAAGQIAEWNVMCGIDHFAADDPIVFPGVPGASHMHSFYGNSTTNAATTTASLVAGKSSCGRGMSALDHSAYWVPSLVRNGVVEKNDDQMLVVYYRRPGGANGPQIQPFPIGLRMIAGDAKATSPQPASVLDWDCGGGGAEVAAAPRCSDPKQPIHAELIFPNCWNGHDLDSADHKSHMAYPAANGACPASHPVALPAVTFETDYPGITDGPSYTLSSGGVYSFHGDFFAAWDSRTQNALIGSCLNTVHECADMNYDPNNAGRDIIFRPSYDPFPIRINLANFTATPGSGLGGGSTPAPTKTPAPTATMTPSPVATHTPSPTPSASPAPELPATGVAGALSSMIGLALLGYAVYHYWWRRRSLRRSLRAFGRPQR
jgi:hypothetical protein